MDGGDLLASHETVVFDPAERSFAVLWQPTEGPRTSRICLSELQGALRSWKLLTAVVSGYAYGKCRVKGRVELDYDSGKHLLEDGASAYFDSRKPHAFTNKSDQDAILLTVNFGYRRF